MAESGVSFREVPQSKTFPLRCKEITLVTGDVSGALRDQKLTETAGGYAYHDSGRIGAPTRNRFLYWRTNQDILELTEESLDVNLSGNAVRFRFPGAPILGGVSVHEAHGYVIILVATVSSVHRLMFPHPNKLQKYAHAYVQGTKQSTPSILADVSVASAREPTNSHVLGSVSGAVHRVHTAAAWLTPEGKALFALATNAGSILLIKLPPFGIQGIVSQTELKQASVMQRLWTGLVPTAIRGGSEDAQTSLSLEIHPLDQDHYIFSVCQDHKLRMWSTKNEECVMVADLLDFIPDNIDPSQVAIGGRGHLLRKAVGCTSQAVHLAVFICFTDRCQFSVFQPVLVDSCYKLNHITTVFGPNEDLTDFTLTSSHLWTLWNNGNGEFGMRSAPIMSETPAVEDWLPVYMEPLEKGELELSDDREPRESYADHIFYPGRFSTHELLRALNTYRRSLDPSSTLDMNIPMDVLKMEVSAAVEHEIQVAASEYELADDEYRQLQLQQWARFFSCCTQYKQVGQKALGVFADCVTGLVCVVRKTCASLVRPCHVLEHLYLSGEGACLADDLEGYPVIGEDMSLCRDVVRLCDCLKLLSQCLTPEMESACEQDIYHAQSPNVIAKQLVKALLTEASSGEASVAHTLQDIKVQLQTIQDIVRAADLILRLLDLAQGHPEDLLFGDDIVLEAGRQLSCSHLYASRLATETLGHVLRQMAESHFLLTRDLLLLLTLIVTVGEEANIPLMVAEQIRSDLIGRASVLMPEYFVLRWCAQTVVTPVSSSVMDNSLRQMEALGLREAAAVTLADRKVEGTSTLLELYLQGYGGFQLRALMANYTFLDEDPCALWSSALVPATNALAQILWPVSASFGFAEFLLVSCQYVALQEYVRLTRDWCEWNEASRQFMLAACYLNTNEPYKATDHFVEAVHGVNKDVFLKTLLQSELGNSRHTEVIFFLKIIQLFELKSLPHHVIAMATTAISVSEDDDPNLPTLWSKVFKYHLELGHNDEAYAAMIANPDPSRRKDCLRQLLVMLCERGELQQLVEFPYIDLHDEVVSILESRARSVDLMTHNYYDLLYAFHIFRGNFRKAGSVMYEFGWRLGREVPGLGGLQRQAKRYLAALNALRLVNPNYAWIVKPGAPTKSVESDDMESQSPKHSWDGEEIDEHNSRNLEVLELSELEREYHLVSARLRLLQHDPDPAHMAGPATSAGETVDLLVNAGLYDVATKICNLFDMPLAPIFESLASRCVRLALASTDYQQGDNDLTSQAWAWLEENELGGASSASGDSSSDQAWRLLQNYLSSHNDRGTRNHRAIAEKLLSQAFALPDWFLASYKRINAPELLRLYLNYDHLEEATYLLLDYIDAVLGRGPEYFGLKSCLHYAAPSVWLPYTSIDQLLIALKDVNADPHYRELYDVLEKKLMHYYDILEKVSRDAINAAQTRTKVNTSQLSHGQTMMELLP